MAPADSEIRRSPDRAQVRARRPTRLLVVDDHPVVHQGVQFLLADTDHIEIVGNVASGREAIEATRRSVPDLILLDVRLPDMLAEEAIRGIQTASPSCKIVLFTAYVSPTVAEQAARLRVHGLLGKDANPQDLLDVIVRVAGGEILTAGVSAQALHQAAEKLHATPLTPREHEVLRRAAMGESNAVIAREIFLSPTTVKSYLQSAFQKLGAHNRAQAVAKLAELELL